MEMAFKARENSDYFIIGATFDYTTDEYALFGDLIPIRAKQSIYSPVS